IDCSELWFWDEENSKLTYDQGKYLFELGASSRDIKGTLEARMSGELHKELKTVVARPERIVLRPGDKTATSFSACLNNDSFLAHSDVSVSYRSNDPSVVSVNNEGVATAIKPGIATVFVAVTYNGITVTDSFALKVMPDITATGIKVNGKFLKSFNNQTKAYGYLLKANDKIPKVEASAASKDISVEVEQATGI